MNLVSALLFGGTFAGIVSLMLAIVGRRFPANPANPANPAKAMARMTLSYGVAQIGAPAMVSYGRLYSGGDGELSRRSYRHASGIRDWAGCVALISKRRSQSSALTACSWAG
ncbi:YbfB/YjiJ family MFS transporter [Comamonas thiooxydans]|uniref:YbfB/YjiJ family MFS transporter n=1 Tax=Comamonas thiooxydans TaxID=363952 RepID=UPI001E36FA22|nr:YbfB/YjiJ family MFS transporter [Comamonas thiooxydans]